MNNDTITPPLVAAFDHLVASRGAPLPLAEERALVAKLTMRYAQTLLALDDAQFAGVLAENRQLHEQARIFAGHGISAAEALRRRIRQGGVFGSLLQRFAGHLGALDCLLDLRATAALIHQLIRFEPRQDLPEKILGCEFGAGTAVLSVAAAIPLLASGRTLTIHAFEQSAETLRETLPILDLLRRHSRFRERLTIHLHHGDVISDAPYRLVQAELESDQPLGLWLSETFGHRSRRPILDIASNSCTFAAPSGVVPYSPDQERHYDPFPEVLARSCHHFPGFLAAIANGSLLAFPDLVTPRCRLDGSNSALLDVDGVWRKLHQIGSPYTMLPPCVPSRWFLEEVNSHAKSKKKAGPARKTRG